MLNCELLFGLADKKELSSVEKSRIEGILDGGKNSLFLTEPLNNRYTFSPKESKAEAFFDKDMLTIPVTCVSENSFIRVTVTEAGTDYVYEDWSVKKVERKSDDIQSFMVVFTSKECGNQKWSMGSKVMVEIFNEEKSDKTPFVLQFRVSQYRDIPILTDTVRFEQV